MDLSENCSPNLFNRSSCRSVQFAASCCGAGAVLPLCRSSVPSRGRCSPAAGPGACSASSASASSRPQGVLRRATDASVEDIPKLNDNILACKMPCKVGFANCSSESSFSLPWWQGTGQHGTVHQWNSEQNLLYKAFCRVVSNFCIEPNSVPPKFHLVTCCTLA